MDILFLDANILFSTAYLPQSGLLKLWDLAKRKQVRLVSSRYAVEEARRNLQQPEQKKRLERLLSQVRLAESIAVPSAQLPVSLPQKDQPILAAGLSAGATHLLTGDIKHFGPYYGQQIEGLVILPPSSYMSQLHC